jgi:ribosome recycling factor
VTYEAKVEAEDAKIGVRNARKDANTEIKKLEEGTSRTFVKMPKKKYKTLLTALSKVEELLVVKEAEIMKCKLYLCPKL